MGGAHSSDFSNWFQVKPKEMLSLANRIICFDYGPLGRIMPATSSPHNALRRAVVGTGAPPLNPSETKK